MALVLTDLTPVADVHARALVQGQPTVLQTALEHAASLLRDSVLPSVVGLNNLSIEATQQIVALAELAGARLVIGNSPSASQYDVIQTATLGHARASDVILWVGCDPADAQYPIVQAIKPATGHQVSGTLAQVLELRERGLDDLLGSAQTATAVLPHDIDPRVLGQWHKLAAAMQHTVRLAVLSVPWPAPLGNLRGAAEVVTWQTGLSPLNAGIDFGDGSPRPCSGRICHAADLVIDTGINWQTPPGLRRITIGPAEPTAEVSLITPGLAVGLAAQVMRFDGIILWLCDDPATAPPDPAVQMLEQLRQYMEGRP